MQRVTLKVDVYASWANPFDDGKTVSTLPQASPEVKKINHKMIAFVPV